MYYCSVVNSSIQVGSSSRYYTRQVVGGEWLENGKIRRSQLRRSSPLATMDHAMFTIIDRRRRSVEGRLGEILSSVHLASSCIMEEQYTVGVLVGANCCCCYVGIYCIRRLLLSKNHFQPTSYFTTQNVKPFLNMNMLQSGFFLSYCIL